MLKTLVDESILLDEWVDEWERLFLAKPKRAWKKKQLQKNSDETDGHFAYRLVYSYLVSKGMREIGQFQEMPWCEELLGMALRSHVLDAVRFAEQRAGITYTATVSWSDEAFLAQWHGMCRRAARWALENFDSDTYKKKQEQGRRGGMAYRKWDLKEYLETYNMSVTEAAKTLGVSRPTVYAMRKYFSQEFENKN